MFHTAVTTASVAQRHLGVSRKDAHLAARLLQLPPCETRWVHLPRAHAGVAEDAIGTEANPVAAGIGVLVGSCE